MKITNYKEASTKEERLEFINNFIEFFIEEYDSSKVDQSKIDKSRIQNHKAILPMDDHFIIFKAITEINDEYYFHDFISYIYSNNRVLHLSETNGNSVKMNYNYIIKNVLSWNGVEEKFNHFLLNKKQWKYKLKAPLRSFFH